MDQIEKINFLWKVITRYDHYVESTNIKATLILAWNGLILGTLLINCDEILSICNHKEHGEIIAGAVLLFSSITNVISSLYVFRVVYPYLAKTNFSNGLVYFGDVSDLSEQQYLEKIVNMDTIDIIEDLTNQSVIVAIGLREKMNKLKVSIIYLGINMSILSYLVIFRIL